MYEIPSLSALARRAVAKLPPALRWAFPSTQARGAAFEGHAKAVVRKTVVTNGDVLEFRKAFDSPLVNHRGREIGKGWQFHAKPSSQAAGVSQTLTIHAGEPRVSLEELKDEYEELRASLHVFTKLPAIPEEEEEQKEEDGGVACVDNPDVVGVEIEPVKAKSTDGFPKTFDRKKTKEKLAKGKLVSKRDLKCMLRSMGDNKADQDIAGLMSELSALDEMEAEIRQSAEEKAEMRDKMMQELVSLRQDKDNTAKKMTVMAADTDRVDEVHFLQKKQEMLSASIHSLKSSIALMEAKTDTKSKFTQPRMVKTALQPHAGCDKKAKDVQNNKKNDNHMGEKNKLTQNSTSKKPSCHQDIKVVDTKPPAVNLLSKHQGNAMQARKTVLPAIPSKSPTKTVLPAICSKSQTSGGSRLHSVQDSRKQSLKNTNTIVARTQVPADRRNNTTKTSVREQKPDIPKRPDKKDLGQSNQLKNNHKSSLPTHVNRTLSVPEKHSKAEPQIRQKNFLPDITKNSMELSSSNKVERTKSKVPQKNFLPEITKDTKELGSSNTMIRDNHCGGNTDKMNYLPTPPCKDKPRTRRPHTLVVRHYS